jgi:hypothetical protein
MARKSISLRASVTTFHSNVVHELAFAKRTKIPEDRFIYSLS